MLGEETALLAALEADGLGGVWVPAARVRHFVAGERLTPAYLWDYNRGYGCTEVRRNGRPGGRPLFGAPRWLYARYANLLWRSYVRRLLGRPGWVETFVRAARVSGMIAECRAGEGK